MKISHMLMNDPSRQPGRFKALGSIVGSSHQTQFGYKRRISPYDLKPVRLVDRLASACWKKGFETLRIFYLNKLK